MYFDNISLRSVQDGTILTDVTTSGTTLAVDFANLVNFSAGDITLDKVGGSTDVQVSGAALYGNKKLVLTLDQPLDDGLYALNLGETVSAVVSDGSLPNYGVNASLQFTVGEAPAGITEMAFTGYDGQTYPPVDGMLSETKELTVTGAAQQPVLKKGGAAVAGTWTNTGMGYRFAADDYLDPESGYELMVGDATVAAFTTAPSQGVLIKGLQVDENNQATAEYIYTAAGTAPKTIQLSVASYDGMEMKAIAIEEFDTEHKSGPIAVTLVDAAGGTEIRGFAWDADSQKPLAPYAVK